MVLISARFYSFTLFIVIISVGFSIKQRPLVFVLCLKGFRWDLPYIYSSLPNLGQLMRKSSRPFWVESEFGGSQTNILSLMSGLHVEDHDRQDFIETIPVLNEHVGGHTALFHWPWFDFRRNDPSWKKLRTFRKSQPEIIEPYRNRNRMPLENFMNKLPSMIKNLLNENDRTNLLMSFVDEPFFTLKHHGIQSDMTEKTFNNIDQLIGNLLTLSEETAINFIILGDHGFESTDCRREIRLERILGREQLDQYVDRYSGTSFSFVLYPKTEYARRWFLIQLRKLPKDHVEIYSEKVETLPSKLRLPVNRENPLFIIVFAKSNFYFVYDKNEPFIDCPLENKTICHIKVDHSNDPKHLSMRTALFGFGPLFKSNHVNEPISITDVHNLLRRILCVFPFSNSENVTSNVENILKIEKVSKQCKSSYFPSLNIVRPNSMKNDPEKTKFVLINVTKTRSTPSNNIDMRVIIN